MTRKYMNCCSQVLNIPVIWTLKLRLCGVIEDDS